MINETINKTGSSDFAGNGGAKSKNKKRALSFPIAAAVALIALLVGISIYNAPTNRIRPQRPGHCRQCRCPRCCRC